LSLSSHPVANVMQNIPAASAIYSFFFIILFD
jgi:hypothetical protein